MTPLLTQLLAQAKKDQEVAAKATEGPWGSSSSSEYFSTETAVIRRTESRLVVGVCTLLPDVDANAEFVAHSRTALPASARVVEILIEALEMCRAQRNYEVIEGKVRSTVAGMNYEKKLDEELAVILAKLSEGEGK